MTGGHRPTRANVWIAGQRVDRLARYEIARRGASSRTYQIVRPFADMSVLENVMVGSLFGRADGAQAEGPGPRRGGLHGSKGREHELADTLNSGERRAARDRAGDGGGSAAPLLDEAL